jgi:hypothetical protein
MWVGWCPPCPPPTFNPEAMQSSVYLRGANLVAAMVMWHTHEKGYVCVQCGWTIRPGDSEEATA